MHISQTYLISSEPCRESYEFKFHLPPSAAGKTYTQRGQMTKINQLMINEWGSRAQVPCLIKYFHWLLVAVRISTKCLDKVIKAQPTFSSSSLHRLSPVILTFKQTSQPVVFHTVDTHSELCSWFTLCFDTHMAKFQMDGRWMQASKTKELSLALFRQVRVYKLWWVKWDNGGISAS